MISIKTSTYNFRGERKADIPRVNTTRYGLRSFRSEASQIWNSLPNNLRMAESYPQFRGLALDVNALCVVPSFVFLLSAYGLPCFASLCCFCFTKIFIHYPILLYTCDLEIFAFKTTWRSKVLLLFFIFFAFRAPACQQDVITLQHKFCLTVIFPKFFKGRLYVTLWVLLAFTVRFVSTLVYWSLSLLLSLFVEIYIFFY